MPRSWISVPILRTGIRIGRSIADAELQPRLPSYRRYELRRGLQAAAEARGEPLAKEAADYLIDKAMATGALDSAGNPTIHVKGTREEIVELMEGAAAWGQPMTQEQAEAKAAAAISTRRPWPAWMMPTVVGAVFLIIIVMLAA